LAQSSIEEGWRHTGERQRLSRVGGFEVDQAEI
jgi:hypothetical protein